MPAGRAGTCENPRRVYGADVSHEFDVQRRSPYTPEGQIEQAGHFGRGMVHRFGRERIGRIFLAGALLCVALAVIAIVS